MIISNSVPASRIWRLDVSDWSTRFQTEKPTPAEGACPPCDWCGEECAQEYVVLDDEHCDVLCTMCWGQAPGYVTLREWGLSRAATLARLGRTDNRAAAS